MNAQPKFFRTLRGFVIPVNRIECMYKLDDNDHWNVHVRGDPLVHPVDADQLRPILPPETPAHA